jgi:hypothetical protein
MVFLLILIPIYLLFVLQAKYESTWKLAFRDGAKNLAFWSIYTPCVLLVAGTPIWLARFVFGEYSYWAGVFGTIGGIAAFVTFVTLVNKKFPFF